MSTCLLVRARYLGKWVGEGNAKGLEVTDISGDHCQPANQRCRGNESVFKVMVRPTVHQLCPPPKDGGVRRQNTVTLRDAVEPALDLPSLYRILMTRYLNSRLYFSDGDGRHEQ